MTRRILRAVPSLIAAVFLTACGGRSPVGPSGSADGLSPGIAAAPVTAPPRVAIISIDGLRPDALTEASAPNILALANRGAYSWRAKTIMPSTTLPSHTSMLTGYGPDVHGISWDDYQPARGPLLVPTLFSAAHEGGLRTAMVVGKEKFALFRDSGSCDTWLLTTSGDADIVSQASRLMSAARPDLLFVHLPDVDLTGHATQWMSDDYKSAVSRADQAVGRLLLSLPADMTVILTADHGGHLNDHGTADAVDTTIPWIIAGPTIQSGRQLSSGIATVDTAATAAAILGVSLPADSNGRVISEAFRQR